MVGGGSVFVIIYYLVCLAHVMCSCIYLDDV